MGKKEEKITETSEEIVEEKVEDQTIDEKDKKIIALEEEISNLKNEIEKIKKAAADIVNRNRQIELERKYSSSDLIKKLLVPMSYFEEALKLQSDDENLNNFLKGFEMIYNLIFNTLETEGLKEIETKINDKFDPRYHEVSELIEIDEGEEEIILEIIQKGYQFKDRVIKPVQVKVSTLKKENVSDNDNKEEI